ncbi:hypothetical protein M441DRAFT_420982 [Trichoderma asperellum CBS 433.97]|uniref:Uncharacterized protein n=1 Tax=Trichoderma asperellum (strain ATCC 204424 / CBS 433.97 / NBRC 101777) TaxID=1042311 RepID=A0A2T3Z4V1_TRIA4|nr:hypothetical protein M441DRAFT_420982 [Trichoderma asperellum CBS 433.97]PTB39839.1 hypothetical protein M441DRAFT_420982 [Trichoderma asperellum CBS 433.97]
MPCAMPWQWRKQPGTAHLRMPQILGGNTCTATMCSCWPAHAGCAQAQACQAPQVPVRASAASLRTRPLPCPTETFCACQRTTQQLAHTPFEVAVHACTQKGSERAGRSRCWHLPLRKFALDPHPPCPTRTTFDEDIKIPRTTTKAATGEALLLSCSRKRLFCQTFPPCVSDILHCREPRNFKSSTSPVVLDCNHCFAVLHHTLSPSVSRYGFNPPVGHRWHSVIDEKQKTAQQEERGPFLISPRTKRRTNPPIIPIILRLPIERPLQSPCLPLHPLTLRSESLHTESH